MRISVQGENEGGLRVVSKASSLGSEIGFALGPKIRWFCGEGLLTVLNARRWVDVARPPSEVSWVMSCEIVLGREGSERVRGRLSEDACMGPWSLLKLPIRHSARRTT